MQIEYTKSYKEICVGKDWKLFSDIDFKDVLIVHKLQKIAMQHTHLHFEDLGKILVEYYNHKSEKSHCWIDITVDTIEVRKKGHFPRFYVEKIKES